MWRALVLVGLSVVPLSCDSLESCEPSTFGLSDAQRVRFRDLPSPDPKSEECTRARLEVLATQAEVNRAYSEYGVQPAPEVDFTRERVILQEGSPGGVTWAVASGETGIIGLRSCAVNAAQPLCIVRFVAVEAIIRQAETRTCQPVPCGVQPVATAFPRH
jgi:hypothetical protein